MLAITVATVGGGGENLEVFASYNCSYSGGGGGENLEVFASYN